MPSVPSGAAPTAPAPPPPPASAIDWERWLGLRGAAVLGAAALALAGLLFFQYSIQHGLITPAMRVVIGVAVGAGCMVASELLRPRGYRYTAEGLGGAGAVILYAAFWSAHALYELIGLGTSFGLMAAVTAACCVLSVRSGTQTVALLGLVGGFATPLILKSEVDRTLGLFGYILLLDVGLLAVGWKRRWPWLGALSLAGTVLIQALWVGSRMGPSRLLLGVAMLGLFALLFAVAGELAPAGNPRERRAWVASQAGAILLPFTFALYFAGRTDFGPRLLPVALLLALLAAAAGWIGRAQGARWLGTGAAAGCVVTIGLWLVQRPLSTSGAWEAAGVAVGLALIFHVFVELDPAQRRGRRARPRGRHRRRRIHPPVLPCRRPRAPGLPSTAARRLARPRRDPLPPRLLPGARGAPGRGRRRSRFRDLPVPRVEVRVGPRARSRGRDRPRRRRRRPGPGGGVGPPRRGRSGRSRFMPPRWRPCS